MGYQLKICREACGRWSAHGLSPLPVEHLPSLSAAIACARQKCAAAPATIELLIDGFYAVAHQERGWPRQLVARKIEKPRPASPPADLGAAPTSSHFPAWLRRAAAHGKREQRS